MIATPAPGGQLHAGEAGQGPVQDLHLSFVLTVGTPRPEVKGSEAVDSRKQGSP